MPVIVHGSCAAASVSCNTIMSVEEREKKTCIGGVKSRLARVHAGGFPVTHATDTRTWLPSHGPSPMQTLANWTAKVTCGFYTCADIAGYTEATAGASTVWYIGTTGEL